MRRSLYVVGCGLFSVFPFSSGFSTASFNPSPGTSPSLGRASALRPSVCLSSTLSGEARSPIFNKKRRRWGNEEERWAERKKATSLAEQQVLPQQRAWVLLIDGTSEGRSSTPSVYSRYEGGKAIIIAFSTEQQAVDYGVALQQVGFFRTTPGCLTGRDLHDFCERREGVGSALVPEGMVLAPPTHHTGEVSQQQQQQQEQQQEQPGQQQGQSRLFPGAMEVEERVARPSRQSVEEMIEGSGWPAVYSGWGWGGTMSISSGDGVEEDEETNIEALYDDEETNIEALYQLA